MNESFYSSYNSLTSSRSTTHKWILQTKIISTYDLLQDSKFPGAIGIRFFFTNANTPPSLQSLLEVGVLKRLRPLGYPINEYIGLDYRVLYPAPAITNLRASAKISGLIIARIYEYVLCFIYALELSVNRID